jgi:hypothetical protein
VAYGRSADSIPMIERPFPRAWLFGTWLYLFLGFVAVGIQTHGTFHGAVPPLGELLAAPLFLSFRGLAVYTGRVTCAKFEFRRVKNPVSFWMGVLNAFVLSGLLLYFGIRDIR